MHLSFLYCGASTILCGAILPALAQLWRGSDFDAGILLGAQFLGSFLGAISISNQLRKSVLRGCLAAGSGFCLLAIAARSSAGEYAAMAGLLLVGFGVGHATTAVNLLAALGNSQEQRRSASLSLLNFTWSVGAVLSPSIAGLILTHWSLTVLFTAFSASALLLLLAGRLALPARAGASLPSRSSANGGISLTTLTYFSTTFFLYGGLEATLGGWLSTYAHRYAGLSLPAAAYISTILWTAFTVGRGLAAGLLRLLPESRVRSGGLLLTLLATLALRLSTSASSMALCTVVIGVGLSPFFPITFAKLVTTRPTPRQTGAATACVALGATLLPSLTGFLSSSSGSLQTALGAPVAFSLALLLLCVVPWKRYP